MSSGGRGGKHQERVVTDAVYERFRLPDVYCETCERQIVGTAMDIEKHFNVSHPSNSSCCYCHGKVFNYIVRSRNLDGTQRIKEEVFHRCSRSSE